MDEFFDARIHKRTLGLDAHFWEKAMIKKLYNLKKLQLDQSFSVMQNLKNQVFSFEEQNGTLQNEINTQSVSSVGAIRDFYALEIHKKNLRQMIQNNFQEIESLQAKISIQNQIIAQLMK